MSKELKTRILLRNDTAANWISFNPTLIKGEVGIENDTGLCKIGDGTSAWTALSYINDLKTHVTVGTESQKNSLKGMTSGDIFIVKKLIYGDKYQHICYIYDGKEKIWKAADGNYNASDVYFDSNLIFTKPVGTVTIGSSGSTEFAAAGKNVYDVLSEIFAKEDDVNLVSNPPSVSDFKLTCTTSVESGSSVTPSWSAGFYNGKYKYKSATTNVPAELTKDKIKDGTGVPTPTWLIKRGSTTIGTANTGSGNAFTIGDANETITATASYGNGYYALTNLQKLPKTEQRITAGSKSATQTIYSYRKEFAGGTTNTGTIDSQLVRSLSGRAWSKNAFEFKAVAGDKKVIFAFPAKDHGSIGTAITATPKFEMFTMSWGPFSGFKEVTNVQVANNDGVNGKVAYRVFEYVPAAAFAAETTKFRVIF